MKILIAGKMKSELVNLDNPPRIGDRVYMGYLPAPKVLNVIWFPPEEILEKSGVLNANIAVFVEVE